MTDERVSYFTGTDAKPIQIWIWKSWLLVVCSLTLFTPWELKPHQKVWRRCVICFTQTVAQEMHITGQRAGIIIIIDYHMRSCLAIEFSHEFDSKYYIGTFADPKPSFETQTNSLHSTQIFKVVPQNQRLSIESHMGNKRNFRTRRHHHHRCCQRYAKYSNESVSNTLRSTFFKQ